MDVTLIGVVAIAAMFVLMALGVPVAIAMTLPALIGIIIVVNPAVLAATVDSTVWNHGMNYPLVTIPLFVLMGEVLFESGVTGKLYGAIRAWFGRMRGGLAVSSVAASAIFAASSGSSLATTGTMGVVASKEMLDVEYDQKLVSGSIVAGGGLGILIPPSTLMILYGTLTEESIGKLLMAGLIPGIVLTLLLCLTIVAIVTIKPEYGPGAATSVSWRDKIRTLAPIAPIAILFIAVMGSMYSGWASPTEAAALGAVGAIVIAAFRASFTMRSLLAAVERSVRTTGFIFAIVLGSFLLNYLLAITQIAPNIARFISELDAAPVGIFIAIVLMYLVLGAFMDSMAMVVITVPLLLPVIQALGWDPIWFGVVLVLLVEIALITPPVGMNNFVLKGVVPQLHMGQIMRGAVIFCVPLLLMVALVYAFPDLALFLPSRM